MLHENWQEIFKYLLNDDMRYYCLTNADVPMNGPIDMDIIREICKNRGPTLTLHYLKAHEFVYKHYTFVVDTNFSTIVPLWN